VDEHQKPIETSRVKDLLTNAVHPFALGLVAIGIIVWFGYNVISTLPGESKFFYFIVTILVVVLIILLVVGYQNGREKEKIATEKVEDAQKRAFYASDTTAKEIDYTSTDRNSLDLPALFDLYSKQIEKYQIETRGRAIWSFIWAVVAMVGGLSLLLFGAWHVFNGNNSDAIPASAVTIVGSAVSGFIAKTFLDAHRNFIGPT
jgi:hypothetical protein